MPRKRSQKCYLFPCGDISPVSGFHQVVWPIGSVQFDCTTIACKKAAFCNRGTLTLYNGVVLMASSCTPTFNFGYKILNIAWLLQIPLNWSCLLLCDAKIAKPNGLKKNVKEVTAIVLTIWSFKKILARAKVQKLNDLQIAIFNSHKKGGLQCKCIPRKNKSCHGQH